ncbi:mannosyl-oligosaccharide glucosidase [Ostrinia furnacalis]|uniref:mannosyl-oligosaccharide glucosidase n=1 Tax=Ostrinia furnacalis TaxID=93504 RepID=UPI00103BB524|nr:mannosyl-oligosaccharide glucosidase [Ostrinia furnacalis]
MVRNRKSGNAQPKPANNNESRDSSSGRSVSTQGNNDYSWLSGVLRFTTVWKSRLGFMSLLVAIYVGALGYLETRVNTPFDDKNKVVQETGLAIPERYWGSYRPNVYFGMKTREPQSPVFGMMWYNVGLRSQKEIRHWCDQGDNLPTYGWLRHDGVSFGEQLISDPPHTIMTSFIKTMGGEHGGHWTARINVTAKNSKKSNLMLVWYAALDESLYPVDPEEIPESRLWMEDGGLQGFTPELLNFRINFTVLTGKVLNSAYSEAHAPGLQLLKETYYSLLRERKHPTFGRVAFLGPDHQLHDKEKNINFLPIQMLIETPFVMDLAYTTEDYPAPPLQGKEYTKALEEKKKGFDEEFEKKFGLSEKGYPEDDIAIARAAMSNMLGGVGYFYGSGRVQSPYTREPVPYWRAPLYTAVPSRSFFPRGFLWDEGFHGLLIGRWSPDIQMDIAAHWMDLINVEGWIPREQILGAEALARVPKEFVVQNNAAANPPMLLIQLARLVKTRPHLFEPGMPHRATLGRMFTRLQAWYNWFQTTQKGEEPTAYRWRGREDDGMQLNPKSLSSGLDDYPRASHPSDIERHVDLRCWMYAAADSLATIARAIKKDPSKFEATKEQLGDEDLLNELHWSTATQTYADYGMHTDGVRFVRTMPKHPGEPAKLVRGVTVPPQPKLVTSAFGYISLFPMLLRVLTPESENLGKILENLDKPGLLWSPFGLRSLSKSSPLYMKRNTEHDPPYWRGQIWININYLALSSLKYYANAPGPHMDRARELHSRLKNNVVRNILSEYRRTGYLWEQYSGEDGRGSGCKPFSGWTALVTLIMAEEY